MTKKLLLLAALFVGQVFGFQALDNISTPKETYVYICTGPNAKKYHSSRYCYGLKKCSKGIKRVTKNHAVKIGRTPCKICYPDNTHLNPRWYYLSDYENYGRTNKTISPMH